MNTLVIRADANAQIGTGHVMRCLALAQEWRARGGTAILVSRELAPALAQRMKAEQISLVPMQADVNLANDAAFLIDTARAQNAEWVVFDGYQFDANYQRAIKEAGFKLLVLDDNGDYEYYYADFVLNQNLHATPELYAQREAYTKLLLGNRYVLLRREFLEWRMWERQIPDVAKRILVTLGGGDPDNVTLRVMQALNEIDIAGLESVIVIGAANPHRQVIERTAAQSRGKMRVETNVTDMPALMAWADVAISGAGSTVWELAFMGLPSIVVTLAENQKSNAERLQEWGTIYTLGWFSEVGQEGIVNILHALLADSAERRRMSLQGRKLIDGQGAANVVARLTNEPIIELRRARFEDAKLIWEWANDAATRANSFSSAHISWETHTEWFAQKLASENCKFFMAQNCLGEPIGQIRFEIQETGAMVSTSVAPQMRGRGYGTLVIACGAVKLFATSETQIIHAFVKPENEISLHAFLNAGYKILGMEQYGKAHSLHLILERNERAI